MKRNLLLLFPILALLFSGCRSIVLGSKVSQFEPVYPSKSVDISNPFLLNYDLDTNMVFEWVFDLNSSMSTSIPYISNDFLVTPTRYGKIYAVDLKKGKQLGSQNIDGGVDKAFYFEDEMIYTGTSDKDFGTLSAINVKSGEIHWTYETGSIESELLVTENRIYFGTYTGEINSVSKANGTSVWSVKLEKNHRLLSNFLDYKNSISFVDDKGFLYSLSKEDGKILKKAKIASNFDGKISLHHGFIYLADRDGNIMKIDENTFDKIWEVKSPFGKIEGGFTFEGDYFFAVTVRSSLVKISLGNGKIEAIMNLEESSSVNPVVTPHQFILSLNNSKMIIVDRSEMKIIKTYDFDGRVKSPLYLVSSGEGYVYVEDKMLVKMKTPEAKQ